MFKVITLSAALETTKLTPSDAHLLRQRRHHAVQARHPRPHPHGTLSVQEVLEKSSNIGAIQIGLQVGDENLHNYVRRFGFGRQTGIPLPGESTGWCGRSRNGSRARSVRWPWDTK